MPSGLSVPPSPLTSSRHCVVVLGAGGVGKSALSIQYVQGVFVATYDPTIMDSLLKADVVDGAAVAITVVDTAGQEEYADHRAPYIRTADACIFVYSVTDGGSFSEVSRLFDHALSVRGNSGTRMPFFLVGNKIDIAPQHRAVTPDQGRRLAVTLALRMSLNSEEASWMQQNPPFMETTATAHSDAVAVFHRTVSLVTQLRKTNSFAGRRAVHVSGRGSASTLDEVDSQVLGSSLSVSANGSPSMCSSSYAKPSFPSSLAPPLLEVSDDDAPVLVFPEQAAPQSPPTALSPISKDGGAGGKKKGKQRRKKESSDGDGGKKKLRCTML